MNRKRRIDSNYSNVPGEKWDELSERLRYGVIVAEDNANNDIEYFIMPGEKLLHSTSDDDSNEPVGVAATANDSRAKKSKETYHLIVQEKKGGGGFGVVYRAGMTTPGGQVSRDICLKQARDNSWDTLIKENDIFSHIHNHPHDYIIRRLFLCLSPVDTFLGLEYFDGLTLSDHIAVVKYRKINRNSSYCLGHKHLMTILQQQTEAIQHLQRCGILHCDFKPDNILYNDSREQSKLIDFGLAVYRYGVSESFKSQGGTTEYMAPETLVDAELHLGTDLFGLGAALHHLITLETPWHSIEDVKALKANKIDHNQPDAPQLKAKRRVDIRTAIKAEICRYRSELGEDEEEIYRHLLAVQEELMCNQDYEFNIRDIICKMLRHNPMLRPDCEDILKYLRVSVNINPVVNKQISVMSSQSSSTSSLRTVPNGYDIDDPGEDNSQSLQSTNNVPLVLSDSQLGSSFQEMQIDISSNRVSSMAPAFSMLNKPSSHIHQPSDAARGPLSEAYPSTDMMSVSRSGMEPTDSEYGDPTGMSTYMAQHQSSESSSFSMPHSEENASPGSAQHSLPDGTVVSADLYVELVEADGDQLVPHLTPAGTFKSIGLTPKAPEDDDEEDEYDEDEDL